MFELLLFLISALLLHLGYGCYGDTKEEWFFGFPQELVDEESKGEWTAYIDDDGERVLWEQTTEDTNKYFLNRPFGSPNRFRPLIPAKDAYYVIEHRKIQSGDEVVCSFYSMEEFRNGIIKLDHNDITGMSKNSKGVMEVFEKRITSLFVRTDFGVDLKRETSKIVFPSKNIKFPIDKLWSEAKEEIHQNWTAHLGDDGVRVLWWWTGTDVYLLEKPDVMFQFLNLKFEMETFLRKNKRQQPTEDDKKEILEENNTGDGMKGGEPLYRGDGVFAFYYSMKPHVNGIIKLEYDDIVGMDDNKKPDYVRKTTYFLKTDFEVDLNQEASSESEGESASSRESDSGLSEREVKSGGRAPSSVTPRGTARRRLSRRESDSGSSEREKKSGHRAPSDVSPTQGPAYPEKEGGESSYPASFNAGEPTLRLHRGQSTDSYSLSDERESNSRARRSSGSASSERSSGSQGRRRNSQNRKSGRAASSAEGRQKRKTKTTSSNSGYGSTDASSSSED